MHASCFSLVIYPGFSFPVYTKASYSRYAQDPYSRPPEPSGRKKLSVLGPAARSYRFWGPLGTIWDLWGPSGDHLGTIWEIDSMKLSVSLRIRTFRSARIDPSSLPRHRRTNFKKSCRRKKSNIKKEWKKDH